MSKLIAMLRGRTASVGIIVTLVMALLVIAACAMPGSPTPEAAADATEATAPEAAAPDAAAPATDEVAARDGMFDAAPEMSIDPAKFYYATLKTEHGDIKLQLYADRAPVTVNNFVFLAREGFYDNTTFHRVLQDFMAQAGDPTGTGMGGPGYEFADEFWPGATFDRRSPVVEEEIAQFRKKLEALKKEKAFDEFIFVTEEKGDTLEVEVFAAFLPKGQKGAPRKGDAQAIESAIREAPRQGPSAQQHGPALKQGLKGSTGGASLRGGPKKR